MYAICALNKERFKVSTGVKVEDKFWKNNELSKSHPSYKQLKEIIDLTLQNLINAYSRAKASGYKLTLKLVKREYFKQPEQEIVFNDFFKDFLDYIELKTATIEESSIRNYKSTLESLKEFQSEKKIKLDIDTFDQKVFSKLLAYFIKEKKYLDNTVEKKVKMLKAFLRHQYPKFDQSFIKYKPYIPEVITLTKDELMTLKQAQVHGYIKKSRDLFLFLCYTGMRFSDSQLYQPYWEDDGVIDYIMKKTKQRAVTPLTSEVKSILKEYGGIPPRISNQKFNLFLKKLFVTLNLNRQIIIRDRQGNKFYQSTYCLYEVVSSHVARKTFITLLLQRGVPITDLMTMSGHGDYREVKPYLKISRDHIRKNFSNLEF